VRIQLWSYNYAPEPTGIGPISTLLAEGLGDVGHQVIVVAAHPHYPVPKWGSRVLPYREDRNGIRVLRLPLWIGRETAEQRIRQELTFTASQFAALPILDQPDVLVSVSPSFPALLPALVNTRARRLPWVLWLHDLLPAGAVATGLVAKGPVLKLSRWLERASYRAADRIVVLSGAFMANLHQRGVSSSKLELIYDPATRFPPEIRRQPAERPRVLSMGNIGYTQGLAPLAGAFDRSPAMQQLGAKLIIAGDGVAAEDVRSAIGNGLVEMLGVVSTERLEMELSSASLALVSQSYEGTEFNLPSKLMNFMAYGLPIIAAVNPNSEVARLVSEAEAGWVVDSSKAELFPETVQEALHSPEQMTERSAAARAYAQKHFSKENFVKRFDNVLRDVSSAAGSLATSRRLGGLRKGRSDAG
jgi:colanic acid biosynthesis glycosyl transferase WcaI